MPGSYEKELQSLMDRFKPVGGFGIPFIGAEQNKLSDLFGSAERQAGGRDISGFQNLGGQGKSVSQVFAPGARKFQFTKGLREALLELMSRHGQLGESQRQSLMGMLSPIAQERANRPSWISSLLGGALGIGAQVALPGIGGKIFGNQMADMFKQSQGGGYSGGGGYGGGYGAYGQQFPQFGLRTGDF